MKVAVPVWDDSLKVFKNAGHTPFFAVFNTQGSGMFKTVVLEELRANPRVKIDHEDDCANPTETGAHKCNPDDAAHIEEHRVTAQILNDCSKLVCHIACKNTKNMLKEANIDVVICKDSLDAKSLALKAF